MASFGLNSSSGVARTLVNGETGFVGQDGALYVEGGDAINGTGSIRLTVLGSVVSGAGEAIYVEFGGLVTLDVGADGYVGSMIEQAVQVEATDALFLRNAGLLSGYTYGVFFQATDGAAAFNLINSGTITSGFFAAIRCNAGTGTAFVMNSGSIITQSVQAAVDITSGGFAEISNSGLIQALTSEYLAVQADTLTQSKLVNTGIIIGGIGFGNLADTLNNSGTISGNINLGDLNDSLTNAGLIIGDILGGGGVDMIDTQDGRIEGVLRGGLGNDTYQLGAAGGTVSELVDQGFDTVQTSRSYTLSDNIEVLRLTGSLAIDGYGSAQTNTLVGNTADNLLSGRGGNDLLFGNDGDDTLRGGAGDDVVFDTDGDDVMNGGSGFDAVNYGLSVAAIVVNLTSGIATGVDIGKDRLNGIEAISGGTGNDGIIGTAADESMTGGGGNDTLAGGGGNDTLNGGLGRDALRGGGGADRFIFATADDSILTARDRIADFDLTLDVIDLSQMDAETGSASDDDFTFVGSGPFVAAGDLRAVQDAGKGITRIEGDIDGDGLADFHIDLTGLLALAVGNFGL